MMKRFASFLVAYALTVAALAAPIVVNGPVYNATAGGGSFGCGTTTVSDDFAGSGALSGSWSVTDGAISRVSGEAVPTTSTLNMAFFTGTAPSANQCASIVLGASVATDSDSGVGPCVRCTASSGEDAYFAQVNTVETKLYKRVGGSYTQIGADVAAGAAGDTFTLSITGTSLTLKKNGTTILGPTTDASIAGAASWGIWAALGAGAANVTSWAGGTP